MNQFAKKCIIFSIPGLIFFILIAIIDPYNIIKEENNPKLIKLKSKISYKLNYVLYKLPKYKREPTDIVILGDSRANQLKASTFESLTGMNVTNLAYGAGTLSEIIKTFWYVTNIHDVKRFYIGMNFNMYNNYPNRDRVTGALTLIDSPLSYLTSKDCLKSTWLITRSLITNEKINIGVPLKTKSEFWDWQLDINLPNFYSNYEYPSLYYEELKNISDFCKKNSIELIFFSPPTHIDQRQRIKDFNLSKEEIKFKNDIANIGVLFDFDFSNKLTQNSDNFLDPLHPNDSICEIIISELVTGNLKYARIHN
jgi:hypothetical protein